MKRPQLRYMYKVPDKVARGVSPFTKADGTVAVEELLEEGATGQPHPHACIDTPVRVQ